MSVTIKKVSSNLHLVNRKKVITEIKVGDRVQINETFSGSCYIKAKGIVTAVEHSTISISANIVMDKWSKKWSKHPTSCSMSALTENVSLIK